MDENQLVERKQQIVTAVKAGSVVVGAIIVAPLVFLAIKGIAGIAIAGFAGLFIINLGPVVADKLANWKLKELKAEAARNPIETLQTDYAKRRAALGDFRDSITAFAAAVETFKDKLEGFAVEFPADTAKFKNQYKKMNQLLEVRKKRFKEADTALDQYASEIKRAEAIWRMGQEAAKMNESAGMNQDDFLAQVKVETALDSVTTSMNTAFAELETSLIDETPEAIEAEVVKEKVSR